MFDIDEFTAIINPPEAGILAVGSIVEQAGGQGGRRRARPTACGSPCRCDHRVIDGATGAAFLQTLKRHAREPAGHRLISGLRRPT